MAAIHGTVVHNVEFHFVIGLTENGLDALFHKEGVVVALNQN
jgi:hypothetical protein